MTERATKKQQELLQFIRDFISEHGYGPSYREIMNGMEYKSVSTVAVHVDGLIARGWLRKRDHSARSLEVVAMNSVGAPVAVIPKEDVREIETSRTITRKCDELLADRTASLDDITTLVESLRVLGYDDVYDMYSKKRKQYIEDTV